MTWQQRAIDVLVRLDHEPIPDKVNGAILHTELLGQLVRVRHASSRTEVQLTIRSDSGRNTSLTLNLPEGVAMPFKGGEGIRAEVHAKWDPTFERARHAVVLRDSSGQPRLVLQDAGILAEADLPPELRTADVDGDPVYTDAGRLSHYCYMVVEHRTVVLGPGRVAIAPGDRKAIAIGDSPWVVVAIDNAVSAQKKEESECPAYSLDRLSWLAVSTPLAHD